MLALTRRPNDVVILTDERTGEVIGRVQVAAIKGGDGNLQGRVRLAFDFPPHVRIMREELLNSTGNSTAVDSNSGH